MELKWRVVLVGILTLGLEMVFCDKVSLMEAPKAGATWSWKVSSGWTSASISGADVYFTCDVSAPSKPDHWLTSDPIAIKGAKWIEINMEFYIRDCTFSPGAKPYCHHGFSVYQGTTAPSIPWKPPNGYQNIGNVTAANLWNGVSQIPRDSVTLNVEIKDERPIVFLAFRVQGACVLMLSVKVSNYVCPKTEENAYLMSLPKTVSPYVSSSPTKVNGSCIDNSVLDGGTLAFALCQSNGEWNTSRKCVCNEGFVHKDSRCEECPTGTNKTDIGYKECTQCPANTAPNAKRTRCECQENFYRTRGENYQHSCSAIPSSPRNAKTSIVNASAVVITWTPPKEDGGRLDLYYEVTYSVGCTKCSADCQNEKYRLKNTSKPQLSVTWLKPCANYTFLIYAKNGVNEVAKKTSEPLSVQIPSKCPTGTYKTDIGNKECTQCPANTAPNAKRTRCECQENFYRTRGENYQHSCSAIPSSPRNAKTSIVNASAVVITWTAPKEDGGRLDLYYEVTYSVGCTKCSADCQDEKYRMKNTNKPQLSVTGLKSCANYTFFIYAKNGVSEVAKKTSEPLSVQIPSRESHRESKKDPKKVVATYVIAGAVAGAVFVIILVLVLVIFLRRRSNRRDAGKPQGTEMSSFGLIYIDPSNYAEPLELLKNFASEIQKSNIKLDAVIGGGEFGDVYKGTLKGPDGSTTVAVKILKQGSSAKNREEFLFEASIMGQFDHINVIRLEGVVTKTLPMMIITEYMKNGSMPSFLKSCNKKLTHLQLIGMARGVAAGMEYLAGMNFIHRDLAARNILVGEDMSPKVADFGLSRELDDDPESEYQTQGGKIAIRWTAPEALRYRTFSSASDVWSFGIVLWEIMSFAERPYWDWDNFKVMDRVQAGFRMPAPLVCKTNANQPNSSGVHVACPKIIHDVMMRCWEDDKNKRPKFSEIVKNLDELIRSPEMLKDGYSPTKSNAAIYFNDVESVHDWLESIKMQQYVPLFERAGYQDLLQVSALDDTEIRRLGVKRAGHRNNITKSISVMKKHFSNPGLESE